MSGLAYSESFTVESYFNGVSFTYLIAFVDGVPSSTLLAETTTTQANGLCLTLPVDPKDIADFHKKAEFLYLYFDVKPNLNVDLNITLPKSDMATDNWQFHDSASSILMSNVRYVIPSWYELNTHGLSNILFNAPTGAVSINPGRESLSLDNKTKEWIQAAFDSAADEYAAIANNHIAAQTTVKEQINAYLKAKSSAPYSLRDKITITFQDPIIASKFNSKYSEIRFSDDVKLQHRYSYDFRSSNENEISLSQLYNKSYIINDLKTNYNSAIKAIQAENNTSYYILSPNGVDYDEFIAEVKPVLDLLEITPLYTSEYKVDRETAKRVTSDVQVCSWYSDTKFYNSHEYAPGTTYLYVPISGYNYTEDNPAFSRLLSLYSEISGRLPYRFVGVQKKYLKAVESLDNFIPFIDYKRWLTSELAYYMVHGNPSCIYRLHELPNVPLVEAAREEEARYLKFTEQVKNENRIRLYSKIPFLELDILEYTHKDCKKQLEEAYPLLNDIHYRLNKAAANRYIKLEDFYATNSAKNE